MRLAHSTLLTCLDGLVAMWVVLRSPYFVQSIHAPPSVWGFLIAASVTLNHDKIRNSSVSNKVTPWLGVWPELDKAGATNFRYTWEAKWHAELTRDKPEWRNSCSLHGTYALLQSTFAYTRTKRQVSNSAGTEASLLVLLHPCHDGACETDHVMFVSQTINLDRLMLLL